MVGYRRYGVCLSRRACTCNWWCPVVFRRAGLTGNAAVPAALAGGRVTGLDLTPELLEGARRRAAEAGVELELVEGDAEELPFADGSFDVAVSTFGCMFAPRHEVAAAELTRVLRPGGRLGIAAWTPDGGIGEFFRATAAFAPPPPPDFQPPPLWGTRDHVERLFDGTGVELSFKPANVEFHFESVEATIEEYSTKFGPIVMLRESLEAERWAEAREVLADLYRRRNRNPDGEEVVMDGEYLLTLGTKMR